MKWSFSLRNRAASLKLASLSLLGLLALSTFACVGPLERATPTPSPTTVPFRSRVLNVATGATETVEVTANPGETIFGWFEVRGQKLEIDFSVQGPDGSQVLAKKRYTSRYDFNFPAKAAGEHKLVFDNSFADVEKGVLVSIKVSPAVKKK